MKKTYTKYKDKIKGRNRFHLRWTKELHKMVKRKTPLSVTDVQTLEKYLSNDQKSKRQYFAIDFLEMYQKKIPKELYEPILNAGIRHRDPSYNEHFFILARAMKGKKAFFADLMIKLKKGSNYEKIMTINSFYWNFHFYWAYSSESDESFEKYVKPHLPRFQKRVDQLMTLLIDLFLESKNLILQYNISEYLPRNINRYPTTLQEKGKRVLTEITQLGLPKTARTTTEEFAHIWKAAINDEALGILFFDELKWRKRGIDPDTKD